MRERLIVDQIRCERDVEKMATALAPVKGITEARIEHGNSALVIEYADDAQATVISAVEDAGYVILEREELEPLVPTN